MISVDVDEARVEADGTLEERDKLADCFGSDLFDRDGDRLAAVVIQCIAGAEEEALQEVAAGEAGFDFDGVAFAVLEYFDESGEEVVHTFTELLYVSVLVSGALVAVNGDALVDDIAVESLFLCRAIP